MSALPGDWGLELQQRVARLDGPLDHRRKAGRNMVNEAFLEVRRAPSCPPAQRAQTEGEAAAVLELGQVTIWEGAEAALARAGMESAELLERHRRGDWGRIREVDRAGNREGLRNGHSIVSGYILPTGVRVLVITNADRTGTTVCLGWEYLRELWWGTPFARFLAYRQR